VALTGSEPAPASPRRALMVRLRGRIIAFASSEHSLTQRLAGTVFILRVAAAVLAYGSQILFARWMGTFEFGIYVYVWTWVLLLGSASDFGIATAAVRFIPQYRDNKAWNLLRGFISGSRWFAFGTGVFCGLLGAGLVRLLQPWLDDYTVIPLYLACLTLPAYALAGIQDGISRAHDWMGLGIIPTYVVRQALLTVLMAGAYFGGFPTDAVTIMGLAIVATWVTTLGQFGALNWRLSKVIEPGPASYDMRLWIVTSLPILMVEGFYLILSYTDVLVLQQFSSPEEVAIYYAAAKTLALVAFINFAVGAVATHRYASYYFGNDHDGLRQFLAQSIHWIFWPSLAMILAMLVVGKPMLNLFGPDFDRGYHLMFIMAFGLLARASVGPVERLLNVLGQQRICAAIYLFAFVINLALCLILIPRLGSLGAAIAIATALISESALLFIVTKRRLGLHVFVFGAPKVAKDP